MKRLPARASLQRPYDQQIMTPLLLFKWASNNIQETVGMEAISGYVTCIYDTEWCLAFVLETDKENAEVKVTFLHPRGPSCSFKYPLSQTF